MQNKIVYIGLLIATMSSVTTFCMNPNGGNTSYQYGFGIQPAFGAQPSIQYNAEKYVAKSMAAYSQTQQQKNQSQPQQQQNTQTQEQNNQCKTQ